MLRGSYVERRSRISQRVGSPSSRARSKAKEQVKNREFVKEHCEYSAIVAFMQGPSGALTHTPDIVILGLEAPNVYTCIEVKTFDPTGPTHACMIACVHSDHTDTSRLGAHPAVGL